MFVTMKFCVYFFLFYLVINVYSKSQREILNARRGLAAAPEKRRTPMLPTTPTTLPGLTTSASSSLRSRLQKSVDTRRLGFLVDIGKVGGANGSIALTTAVLQAFNRTLALPHTFATMYFSTLNDVAALRPELKDSIRTFKRKLLTVVVDTVALVSAELSSVVDYDSLTSDDDLVPSGYTLDQIKNLVTLKQEIFTSYLTFITFESARTQSVVEFGNFIESIFLETLVQLHSLARTYDTAIGILAYEYPETMDVIGQFYDSMEYENESKHEHGVKSAEF